MCSGYCQSKNAVFFAQIWATWKREQTRGLKLQLEGLARGIRVHRCISKTNKEKFRTAISFIHSCPCLRALSDWCLHFECKAKQDALLVPRVRTSNHSSNSSSGEMMSLAQGTLRTARALLKCGEAHGWGTTLIFLTIDPLHPFNVLFLSMLLG